ncbi:ATP-binding protein [Rhodococcus globerulus]|uniref:LuxR C-terminal-related transcriptional regulator n=1 Tax=Rhodococcus globerulus TaxID=33008 RepID=A0ABU4C585_RHOGO|nr:LuxR C-terminal-related transcriptional regulator [Rhodococcus globerulus]MDV6271518.1 LuxR C-terminal-related transcriptional regulator [Rhodococcus globerulus]
MAATRGNLPIELSGFVGRRSEAKEVRRLLSENRLVTLTGLGGVGKTRLALRVANDSTRAFPEGVWFVDFSELQEPALLDQTILAALGVQDRSTRSPRSVLIDRLANDRILLVLDNCEHLIECVSDTVAELLRYCARLTLLATSREPLGIHGEMVLRVPPMTLPSKASFPTDSSDGDAMMLFEQRAQSTVTDFRITNENSAVVEKIVRRLEGLPLPIELAAARLTAMSVDQILRRLNDRFQLLTRGSRNAPQRQQTLAQSIDWSFDLCTPPEQFLWAHLSVFAGSFDLESVEGIFSEESENENLDDLVMSLVDKSILIREQDGPYVRYRILETIRDYGRGLLSDDEWDSLQHRHCDWFRQLIFCAEKGWIGPHQIDWMARIDRDLPNVRSALECSLTDPDSIEDTLHAASALHDYWLTRGRFNEGRYWLDRALTKVPARIEGTVGDAVVEAAVTGALLAALQRDIAAATHLTDEARRHAEKQGNDDGRVLATYALGFVAVADGDLVRGAEYLDRAVDAFRANDDIARLVPALYWFAFVVDALGETDRAAGIYEQELAISESHGEIMWRSMTMSDYGSALWRHGDHTHGIELLEDSLRLLQKLDNQFGCAWCLEELAWTLVDRDAKLAATLMGAADTLFTATGSPMATFRSMVSYHEAGAIGARNKIGDKGFQTAFDHGRNLTLDDAIARALREQPLNRSPKTTADDAMLTPRELQVAELVAQGLTNRAIAEKLVISQRTVDGHVDHIRNKLGYGSRTRIAAWVLQRKNNHPNSSESQ